MQPRTWVVWAVIIGGIVLLATMKDKYGDVQRAPLTQYEFLQKVNSNLIASATYQGRRGMAGRRPIDDTVAVTLVASLESGGGRAHRDTLAGAAGVPASTFAGLLASFRRVLNVEGYSVIELDADGVTVLLDVALLREQFHLK